MDRDILNKDEVNISLKENLSKNVFDFTKELNNNMCEELIEFMAEKDEELLEKFLDGDFDYNLWESKIKLLFNNCNIYPYVFGSALHDKNIDVLLELMDSLSETNYDKSKSFTGKVYKIKSDENEAALSAVSQTITNPLPPCARARCRHLRLISLKCLFDDIGGDIQSACL